MSPTPIKPGQLSTDSRRHQNPVEIWGLTGGIASGKSLAAKAFLEAGILVIDADQVAHQLSAEDGNAFPAIVRRFGTADRARLREIVFSDPGARRDLEAILHPLIQAESMNRIQLLAQATPDLHLKVVYEAALLVETGRYKSLAGLILIDAPREVRKQRLIQRDKLDPTIAEKILSAQASDEERRQAATVIIENTGTPEDLRQGILAFVKKQGWQGADLNSIGSR